MDTNYNLATYHC